jgi:hypothetical protein
LSCIQQDDDECQVSDNHPGYRFGCNIKLLKKQVIEKLKLTGMSFALILWISILDRGCHVITAIQRE